MPADAAPVPELQFFGPTAIVFGIISILLYLLVIRPLLPSTNNTNNGAAAAARGGAAGIRGTAVALDPNEATPNTVTTATQHQQHQKCTRVPPHLNSDLVTAVNNGANVLMDGLVAFKFTRAAVATAAPKNSNTNEADDRKARARLLANLLNDNSSSNNKNKSSSAATTTTTASSTPPPAKGSCIVLTLSWDDVTSQCEHQRRALVLLASYYNLLLLVAVPPTALNSNGVLPNADAIVEQLRGETTNSTLRALSVDLLPRHRIVWTSTITGRVAFVRQLQRIELVLDYDPEVKNLLSRFGHRVVLYGQTAASPPQNGGGADNVTVLSKLGRALL